MIESYLYGMAPINCKCIIESYLYGMAPIIKRINRDFDAFVLDNNTCQACAERKCFFPIWVTSSGMMISVIFLKNFFSCCFQRSSAAEMPVRCSTHGRDSNRMGGRKSRRVHCRFFPLRMPRKRSWLRRISYHPRNGESPRRLQL